MNEDIRFERLLEDLLLASAPTRAPARLRSDIASAVRPTRQRPRWIALVRERPMRLPSGLAVGSPTVRLAALVAMTAALILATAGAIAVGASLVEPKPVDQIAYGGVHIVNADGTDDHVIAAGACPRFSADGTSLSVLGAELVVARADGSASSVVPFAGEWPTFPGALDVYALSPDGTLVAWFRTHHQLFVTPVAGGPRIPVLPYRDDPQADLHPVWSPDGRQIAFSVQDSSGSFRSAVDVVDVDGSNLHRITTRTGLLSSPIVWSPDGRTIAFSAFPDGSVTPPPDGGDLPNGDIFVVDADGSNERNLTATRAHDHLPAWSPDGSRLAFLSSDDASGELGERAATVTLEGTINYGSALDVDPTRLETVTWSPDATRLAWVRNVEPGANPSGPPGGAGYVPGRDAIVVMDAMSGRPPLVVVEADGEIPAYCPLSWRRTGP